MKKFIITGWVKGGAWNSCTVDAHDKRDARQVATKFCKFVYIESCRPVVTAITETEGGVSISS